MSKVQEKRQERNRELKQRLTAVCFELLKQYDMEELTIREICEHAGITTGMFYRNFQSKYDLACFCVIEVTQAGLDEMHAELVDLPLEEQLCQLFVRVTEYSTVLGKSGNLVVFKSSDPVRNSEECRRTVNDAAEEYILAAMAKGRKLSRGRTPRQIIFDLFTVLNGILTDWNIMDENYDPVARARELYGRIIGSLL